MTVFPHVQTPLRADLRVFLSYEAPWLLSRLPASDAADDLEAALLAAIHEAVADRELHPLPICPGLTQGAVAAAERDALRDAVAGFFERQRIKMTITSRERLAMHKTMLLTRAIDDHLKSAFDRRELRWGDFPSPQKGFRSTGQEAIVGAGLRLRRPPEFAPGPEYRGDVVSPLIRDLGLAQMFLDDALHPILVQSGLTGTPMDGRDLHVGNLDFGVLPPAAPLTIGTQTLVGITYGFKLRGEDRVGLCCIGDGGSSLGEWHESVNLAAAQRLPVVFVLQNNRWALGTHVTEQTAARRFALRAAGYGMPGLTIFGNDPDEVAAACTWAAERARNGQGPALVELLSYRRSGHAHHDDDRFHGNRDAGVAGYEYEEELRAWEALDPIRLSAERLLAGGVCDEEDLTRFEADARARVAEAAASAAQAVWPTPASYRERVYAERSMPIPAAGEPPAKSKRMAYDEAVRQALIEEMEADPAVFVIGEDVGGRYGGAFGVTRGLAKQFGAARCVNAPIAEGAIVGCAVGAAITGSRAVVEMQFADFLASGFNALVNNAAKLHWRWGRKVPLVVRLPYGGATGTAQKLLGGGPFHSQCPEMWFVRTPGWKIVAPSTPADAKGLLAAAMRDDNPVIFLESKGLYGFFRTDLREDVPLGRDFEVPIGSAVVRREGADLSIFTYGAMTWTALAAAEALAIEGISAEVVDLRTLWPLDEATVMASIAKTNRALLLHEDTLRGGFGAELAARLAERAFFHLDAPIVRVGAPDTPVPYSPPLEYDFLPKKEQVVEAARGLARV
jgi:2-oxoisovalerate dehydrogenase E1 component